MEVMPYENTNELVTWLGDDEVWWIVNGRAGRRPIEATTAEEAMDKYVNRFGQPNDLSEDEVE